MCQAITKSATPETNKLPFRAAMSPRCSVVVHGALVCGRDFPGHGAYPRYRRDDGWRWPRRRHGARNGWRRILQHFLGGCLVPPQACGFTIPSLDMGRPMPGEAFNPTRPKPIRDRIVATRVPVGTGAEVIPPAPGGTGVVAVAMGWRRWGFCVGRRGLLIPQPINSS